MKVVFSLMPSGMTIPKVWLMAPASRHKLKILEQQLGSWKTQHSSRAPVWHLTVVQGSSEHQEHAQKSMLFIQSHKADTHSSWPWSFCASNIASPMAVCIWRVTTSNASILPMKMHFVSLPIDNTLIWFEPFAHSNRNFRSTLHLSTSAATKTGMHHWKICRTWLRSMSLQIRWQRIIWTISLPGNTLWMAWLLATTGWRVKAGKFGWTVWKWWAIHPSNCVNMCTQHLSGLTWQKKACFWLSAFLTWIGMPLEKWWTQLLCCSDFGCPNMCTDGALSANAWNSGNSGMTVPAHAVKTPKKWQDMLSHVQTHGCRRSGLRGWMDWRHGLMRWMRHQWLLTASWWCCTRAAHCHGLLTTALVLSLLLPPTRTLSAGTTFWKGRSPLIGAPCSGITVSARDCTAQQIAGHMVSCPIFLKLLMPCGFGAMRLHMKNMRMVFSWQRLKCWRCAFEQNLNRARIPCSMMTTGCWRMAWTRYFLFQVKINKIGQQNCCQQEQSMKKIWLSMSMRHCELSQISSCHVSASCPLVLPWTNV